MNYLLNRSTRRRLNVAATIFLPLTLLTGYFVRAHRLFFTLAILTVYSGNELRRHRRLAVYVPVSVYLITVDLV